MDFRRCAEPDCAFHIPTTYPFDRCPWHLAPGRSPTEKVLMIGGALVIFAAGWGVAKAWEAFSATRRREQIRQSQDEWRRMSETRRQSRQEPEEDKNVAQPNPPSDQRKRAEGGT